MVLLVDVIISPRAAVPMGAKQIAFLDVWIDACYYICGGEHCTIPSFKIGLLGEHGTAIAFELVDNPLSTLFMGLGVHNARAEITLFSTKDIGAVFTECRSTKW